jgi:hypothetical protein
MGEFRSGCVWSRLQDALEFILNIVNLGFSKIPTRISYIQGSKEFSRTETAMEIFGGMVLFQIDSLASRDLLRGGRKVTLRRIIGTLMIESGLPP